MSMFSKETNKFYIVIKCSVISFSLMSSPFLVSSLPHPLIVFFILLPPPPIIFSHSLSLFPFLSSHFLAFPILVVSFPLPVLSSHCFLSSSFNVSMSIFLFLPSPLLHQAESWTAPADPHSHSVISLWQFCSCLGGRRESVCVLVCVGVWHRDIACSVSVWENKVRVGSRTACN